MGCCNCYRFGLGDFLKDQKKMVLDEYGKDEMEHFEQVLASIEKNPPRKKVFFVPGNLMSQIKTEDGEVIWLDFKNFPTLYPLLKLPDEKPLVVEKMIDLGVLMALPLLVELSLRYQVYLCPYDWRLSMAETGACLSTAIQGVLEPEEHFSLVAHSMGNLVSRSLIQSWGETIYEQLDHFIELGPPNYGYFGAARMFDGKFPWEEGAPPSNFFIRLLIDLLREIYAEIVREFLYTWLGWYEMMPFEGKVPSLSGLYDQSQWPEDFQPHQELLTQSVALQSATFALLRGGLPSPSLQGQAVWSACLGTGINTLTGMSLSNQKFDYTYTAKGDGFIAVNLAVMEGLKTYTFEGVEHLELVRKQEVINQVLEILKEN